MKKIWIGIAVFGVAVLIFGVAGFAYAQSRIPSNPLHPHEPWMMGDYDFHRRGMMGLSPMGWNGEYGPMHEIMIEKLSEKLGLSPEEIEKRHDDGEHLWGIAAAEGLSDEEIQELMLSAHDAVLEEAVESGWITKEQVEWMDDHMDQMWQGDYLHGSHCGSGRFSSNTNGSN